MVFQRSGSITGQHSVQRSNSGRLERSTGSFSNTGSTKGDPGWLPTRSLRRKLVSVMAKKPPQQQQPPGGQQLSSSFSVPGAGGGSRGATAVVMAAPPSFAPLSLADVAQSIRKPRQRVCPPPLGLSTELTLPSSQVLVAAGPPPARAAAANASSASRALGQEDDSSLLPLTTVQELNGRLIIPASPVKGVEAEWASAFGLAAGISSPRAEASFASDGGNGDDEGEAVEPYSQKGNLAELGLAQPISSLGGEELIRAVHRGVMRLVVDALNMAADLKVSAWGKAGVGEFQGERG